MRTSRVGAAQYFCAERSGPLLWGSEPTKVIFFGGTKLQIGPLHRDPGPEPPSWLRNLTQEGELRKNRTGEVMLGEGRDESFKYVF